MKTLYIVANWKENKTTEEAIQWLQGILNFKFQISNKKIIICPPFISVSTVSEFIKSNNLPFEVGVQDISKFSEGAHTGDISAREVREFAKYSIIGHSERRAQGETDEDVRTKVETAVKFNIDPIVCVVNENVPIPSGVKIAAYEPIEAIGTGNPDTPENAERVANAIKSKNNQVQSVLYGGSVNSGNVKSFTSMQNINGVLVGGASLDPHEFSLIIKQC